jgi:hypothetical protein
MILSLTCRDRRSLNIASRNARGTDSIALTYRAGNAHRLFPSESHSVRSRLLMLPATFNERWYDPEGGCHFSPILYIYRFGYPEPPGRESTAFLLLTKVSTRNRVTSIDRSSD